MIYDWAVIGAGPAGIAAVGKLIDYGINARQILWIDPAFTVGDFGTLWRHVSSNTKVKLFQKFLQASPALNYRHCPQDFEINHLPLEDTCPLIKMADPLQWVTQELLYKVSSIHDIANIISLCDRTWHITFKNSKQVRSKNVILAIGAEPKNLTYPVHPVVPLQEAMDSERLHHHVETGDTIAVFGSSHSAILVLQNLVERNVKQIINFYRSPLRYAVYLDDWILFDDSGLKGPTADWARYNIDGKLPINLTRVYSNEANIEHFLPQCNKVVYAVGFERRTLPIIENMGRVSYMEHCGIIAPGLFGVGIAFPEAKINKIGILEYRVGLWKFLEYLHDMLPIWLKYRA